MAEPTIQLGGGNWAGKTDNLLGYYKEGERFYKQDFTFSRSTSGTRVNSSGLIEVAGVVSTTELVTNGDFATDTDWTKETGWSISSGVASYNGSANNNALYENLNLTTGTTYKLVFTVVNYVSGTLVAALSTGSLTGNTPNITANGTYAFDLTATGPLCIFRSTSSFTGSIDNVSVKEVFQNDIPRVDYLNNTNGSLILEPQRSNLIRYSSDFTDGAGWSLQANVTLTSNSAISPDGTLNATKLVGNGTTGIYRYVTASGVISKTIYIKSVVGNVNVKLKDPGGTDEKTVNVTTQWQRFDLIGSNSTSTSGLWVTNIPSSGIYIWGAQLEVGSYPTSIINTIGSSVTRNADACSLTNVADRIGQTEGVVYMDFVAQRTDGVSQSHFWLGASGSEIGLYGGSQFIFYSSGGVQINGGNIVNGQRYKVAFGYKANDYVAYINGTQVGTDTSATVPTMSALVLNSYFDGTELQKKDINDFKLYNTKLSNSELATLTTL